MTTSLHSLLMNLVPALRPEDQGPALRMNPNWHLRRLLLALLPPLPLPLPNLPLRLLRICVLLPVTVLFPLPILSLHSPIDQFSCSAPLSSFGSAFSPVLLVSMAALVGLEKKIHW